MMNSTNPYDHLSEKHLKRQLSVVSRRLTRMALRGKTPKNLELQRVLMLTIADSLDRKSEVEWLERMSEESIDSPTSLAENLESEDQIETTLTSDVPDETK